MNYFDSIIELALLEDAAFEDITARATINERQCGKARIVAKAKGVLSGQTIAQQVLMRVSPGANCDWLKQDGDEVIAGDVIAELSGPLRELLAAERTMLNFMQHLSGIASLTRQFVDQVQGTGCVIVDTRKTAPGLRLLEKQAVVHGRGVNHRMDLSAAFLIKENHIEAAGSITDAIAMCYQNDQDKFVEVECETMDQVQEAIAVSPDIILLDNMTPEQVQAARAQVPESIVLEASGNITLDNVRDYALTGVNRVAIGAITHSAPSLDLSMRVTSGS